ncbi:MAG: transposase [Verrucomicrobia bacterium]|nr:transposase [Verrucomicrobiota bacterium]
MKPKRKQLPHEIPSCVPDGSRYFITVNCRQRDRDWLCQSGFAPQLLASVPVYEDMNKWFVHAMVVMPDHIHWIAVFGGTFGVRPVMSSWKGYFAKELGIDWQYNFFEHRLRNEAEFTEKMQYVLMNPVRKKLVTKWRDWPYTFARGMW